MKLFVIVVAIIGASYSYALLQSANVVVDQTQQLQQQYSTIAERADSIANSTMTLKH